MSYRSLGQALGLAATLTVTAGGAWADAPGYPNWKGEWDYINPRFGGQGVKYDPTKKFGPAQEAPLTEEYKRVHEASMADQARGGQGNFIDHARCIPFGMPAMMSPARMEVIVTPGTTYLSTGSDLRRVFTDGRPWPTDLVPTYQGYALGRWVDEYGSGTYNLLEVETRGPFKGPRHYDAAGLPLHHDEQSIFKERLYLDKTNKNLLHDEITTIDHALTRPWTVTRDFRRNPNPRPKWDEFVCAEGNVYVEIEHRAYYLSADGLLMPMSKGEQAPDLRYFRERARVGGVPASH